MKGLSKQAFARTSVALEALIQLNNGLKPKISKPVREQTRSSFNQFFCFTKNCSNRKVIFEVVWYIPTTMLNVLVLCSSSRRLQNINNKDQNLALKF